MQQPRKRRRRVVRRSQGKGRGIISDIAKTSLKVLAPIVIREVSKIISKRVKRGKGLKAPGSGLHRAGEIRGRGRGRRIKLGVQGRRRIIRIKGGQVKKKLSARDKQLLRAIL